MTTTIPTVEDENLKAAIENCEREPIHQLGQIQSTGFLLALDDVELIIRHVSENIDKWLPYSPSELLGKPFSLLVGDTQAESIRKLVGLNDWRYTAISTFNIVRNGDTVSLDAHIFRSGNLWMVEMEREKRSEGDLFHELFIPIRDALWLLDAETDISRYTRKVVEQVRLLTGYDRVMMYQFDENWDGEVIAESKSDEVESYQPFQGIV